MNSINQVTISGKLGRDPELRYIPNGQAVTEFSVAVVDSKKNEKTGEWTETVSWVDVTAWGKPAEYFAQNASKGTAVVVCGRLKQETWEKDGQKRSKLKVIAQTVSILQPYRKPEDKPGESVDTQQETEARGRSGDVDEDQLPF